MCDEPPEFVPVLTDFRLGTLDGQDIVIVLRVAQSPEDLQADVMSELTVAMTPQQAREIGASLLAYVDARMFEPLAANDTMTFQD